MSFLAKLHIDEQDYNVLEFSFGLQQKTFDHGRPSSMPAIEVITIIIESTNGTGFYDWSISPFEQKEGEIIFYKRDAMASSRILKFTGAFCTGYKENFNNNSKTPMLMHLAITVDKLEFDNTTYISPSSQINA